MLFVLVSFIDEDLLMPNKPIMHVKIPNTNQRIMDGVGNNLLSTFATNIPAPNRKSIPSIKITMIEIT